MEITYDVTHISRHDTEENWFTINPILSLGEIGYVTVGEHAGMSKLGDGVNTWNSLPFTKSIANGGDADTVNGFTVASNVPADLDLSVLDNVAYIYQDEATTIEAPEQVDADTLAGNAPAFFAKASDLSALKLAILGEGEFGPVSAGDVTISPAITGITATNVQGALSDIVDGTTTVGNATKVGGKTASELLDYNNLTNVPDVGGGSSYSYSVSASLSDWAEVTFDNGEKWYALTVTNSEIAANDTVVAYPVDMTTKNNIYLHVRSIFDTLDGSFKIYSNEKIDNFNIVYVIYKQAPASEGGSE